MTATNRAFRVGIAGPVGSGKTALVDRLSKRLWPKYNLAVVTNDIYTKEDAEFLLRQGTLPVSICGRWRRTKSGTSSDSVIRLSAKPNRDLTAGAEYSGAARSCFRFRSVAGS